jgi:hypothetical protein
MSLLPSAFILRLCFRCFNLRSSAFICGYNSGFVLERTMARYLTMHTLACLTRQGAEELARKLESSSEVKMRRALANMIEGKMVVEFEARDRETLEACLARNGMHFDWMLRIEYEWEDGKLVST